MIVAVGGSGVGEALLRRVIASYPDAQRRVNGAADDRRRRAAHRSRRRSAPRRASRSARFVPDLYRHLAACDLAVVQGGLTTTMELAAARRPFLYFPLRNHFEQNRHVRHRLERYGAGRCMDYDDVDRRRSSPRRSPRRSTGRSTTLPVETDGAARAAALIAHLI